MTAQPVYVAAAGAFTSVGRDALSTVSSARAGLSGFTEHPFVKDSIGEPVRVAMVPWLDPALQGVARFEALLCPAIAEAMALPLADSALAARVAVVLALPAPRPGLPANLANQLQASLRKRFGNRLAAFATFGVGHAAAALGLQAAHASLVAGAFDACVVAGVDSYIARETLAWLEQEDQLHGAGPLNNAWGFIPGEAAAAILVTSTACQSRQPAPPLAQVLSVAVAAEAQRIKTDGVCIGEGLTRAFRDSLRDLPEGARVTDMYCDMNGEPYRADEFGFACLRTRESFDSAAGFVASADCWGDVAAASFPLALLQAVLAAREGYANGRHALAWASSESGERGAALVDCGPPGQD